MPDFSILLGSNINARLAAAGNEEQRAKIMHAISAADATLQKEYVPSTDARGDARGAAYHNVQQALTHPQHPDRPLEYVGHGGDDATYEAEVERLSKLVERVVAELAWHDYKRFIRRRPVPIEERERWGSTSRWSSYDPL